MPEVPECTFYIFTQPRAAKQTGPTEPTPKYVSKRPSLEAFLPNFIRISSEFHPITLVGCKILSQKQNRRSSYNLKRLPSHAQNTQKTSNRFGWMSNLRSTQHASEVVTNCHNLKYGSVAKENMFCLVYSNVK